MHRGQNRCPAVCDRTRTKLKDHRPTSLRLLPRIVRIHVGKTRTAVVMATALPAILANSIHFRYPIAWKTAQARLWGKASGIVPDTRGCIP